jgi:hypothetical protein
LNFKKLLVLLTVGFGILLLFSFFKVTQLDLFPWLNVLIISSLGFVSLLFNFLVKGKSKFVQIGFLLFFSVQLIFSFFLLRDAELLKVNWRWLFYPISFLVFVLSFSMIRRKQGKSRLILLVLLSFSLLSFLLDISLKTAILFSIQMIFFVLFAIGMLFFKNKEKGKTTHLNSN